MTKISNQRAYIPDEEINGLDYLPGTDFDQSLKTVNFRVQDLGGHYNQVNGVRNFDFNFYQHVGPTAKPLDGCFYSNSNEQDPNNITHFIFSKKTTRQKDVSNFFDSISVDNPFDLIIAQKVDINTIFFFKITSIETFSHYYKLNVSENFFPNSKELSYTLSYAVFNLKSDGALVHNSLNGLNEGDYIHLTAAEKEKFDNLPDTFPVASSLIREDFTFSGSQTFTLANNYSQVYSIEVQGQGALSTSQYTLVAPNQVTINDTLDSGDYVVIIYSDETLGVIPYYTQAQTDSQFIKNVPNFKFIRSASDFPISILGERTLGADITYFIADTIDLLGDRLVGSANTTIIGGSSENSILTSTGLGVGVPLLSSIYTTPIRNIGIKDVDTAIDFDGSTNPNPMALDWTGVNFVNVPNIGTVKDASNFIFDKGAFLTSKGLNFDGTIATIGGGNSLFSGDGLSGDIIKILPTCVITRRFRINYSSIVAFGSTIGINVDALATIPVEGYILDTVNFSGGGTYLSGVIDDGDNKTSFINCRGIVNTNPNSQYYMNGNATTTPIASAGVPVKALGSTISSSSTQKFINTDNRATYTGALTQLFRVSATLSLISGNNNQIGCYIAKNGVVLNESEIYVTANGSGRAENVTIQTKVSLSTNDYIEIFVENETSPNDILVTDLNTIID